jgi:putative endonuclease
MKQNRRKRAHRLGIFAEYLCMLLLILKGYTVLERRHRNRGGEIDIIAARRNLLAFIEVKARGQEAEALESVNAEKRRRLARAVEAYMATHQRYAQHGLRFDVMVVTSFLRIRHFKNAWRTE